jgi:WD40 repeat protein
LLAVIDWELGRLPEQYRLPLLLCGAEGLARDEAALRLGWSLGTLRGRLERGRELLRKRLSSRGLTVPAVLAVALTADAMPPALVTETTRAALAALTVPVALVSLKALATATMLLAGLGTVALVAQASRERERPEPRAPQRPVAHAPGSPDPAPRVDREGVPLPPGVLQRIGSSRMRNWANDVAVAPDGRTIASAGVDGVRIWDTATGKLISVPVVVRDRYDGPGVAYAANGDLLCIHRRPVSHVTRLDPVTGREWFRVELNAVPDSNLWFAKSGRRFAYRHKDQSLRIGETASGRELSVLRNLSPQLSDIAFSPDDLTLAVADYSDTISLFDTATGHKIGEAKHAECIFNSVKISPDGRTLTARTAPPMGPSQYQLHLWDFPTGKYQGQLPAEDTKKTPTYRFSPDGKPLITAGVLTVPTLWDVAMRKEVRRFDGIPGAFTVAFSPNGKTLVVATGRGTIVSWDVETGRLLAASADPPIWIRGLRYADGGRRLIGASDRVAAWDPETGREVEHWAHVPNGRGFTALSHDQRLLARVDDAGSMRLWDPAAGKEIRKLGGDHQIVSEDDT